MSKAFYVFIDLRFFLYVCVANRYIRFRLIVVIIRNEIVHRAFWKEFAILRSKLSGKRLVMCDNERRLAPLLDDVRHRKSLAGASYTEKCLVTLTCLKTLHERDNCRRLVSRRAIVALYFKRTHPYTLSRLGQ